MAYIDAGSKILTTNSYGCQPHYFRKAYGPEAYATPMLEAAKASAQLAVQARKESPNGNGVKIMGCLPPLCESHRPDLFTAFLAKEGREFCVSTYRSLAESLIAGGVDSLLCETMNSWEEAHLAIEACKDLDVMITVSFEGALRDAALQPHPEVAPHYVKKVLTAVNNGAKVHCIGFNCAPPEHILDALKAIESAPGLPEELKTAGVALAGWANCNDRAAAHSEGKTWAESSREGGEAAKLRVREDLLGDGYTRFAMEYLKHGASWVGGCCGCGPEGIHRIQAAIELDPAFQVELCAPEP